MQKEQDYTFTTCASQLQPDNYTMLGLQKALGCYYSCYVCKKKSESDPSVMTSFHNHDSQRGSAGSRLSFIFLCSLYPKFSQNNL